MHEEALKAAREHDPALPGRFEGESTATVYFYTASLDGGADEEYGSVTEAGWVGFMRVDPEEAAEFGLKHPWYVLAVSTDGFVSGWEADEREIGIRREDALAYEAGE